MAGVCASLMGPVDEHPTVSDIMHQGSSNRAFPGGAVGFGCCSVPFYYGAYGTLTYESSIPVTPQSVWDVASLTKVMVTTPAVMLLCDRGLLELDAVVCKYVPEFGRNGKEMVTIRHLLTHTAGLREFHSFFDMGFSSKQEVVDYIMKDKLWYAMGTTHYSDLSMIVLGMVVERISELPLDEFAAEEFFKPLGLSHTSFRPTNSSDFDPTIAPTEVDLMHRSRLLWGEVHDPTAYLLGGVAGHAGLFSSIVDVCRFAQFMLAGGIDLPTNRRLFREQTVRLFTTPTPATPLNPRPFALGWDVAVRRSLDGYTSAGQFLGPRTFGHTGFTGTSLWIDPDQNLFVALLTNAVHPSALSGSGHKLRDVRPLVADAAVQAMREQAIPREPLTWHLQPLADRPSPLSNVVFVSHAPPADHAQVVAHTSSMPPALHKYGNRVAAKVTGWKNMLPVLLLISMCYTWMKD